MVFPQFWAVLVHWFLKCQCSLLPSPVWSLPIYLIHGPNTPGSYAILFSITLDVTLPPDTSTTEHYFCFGSASSFFLELFLCSSPVAYWAATNLRSSSFSEPIRPDIFSYSWWRTAEMQPQIITVWHKNYFELNATEKKLIPKKKKQTNSLPFYLRKSRT